MKRSRILNTLIFLATFFAHSVAQFFAFGYADSPAHSSEAMRMLWNILAAPLFHLTGSLANVRSWAEHYFLVIGIANSFLWAAILTFVVARFLLGHKLDSPEPGP